MSDNKHKHSDDLRRVIIEFASLGSPRSPRLSPDVTFQELHDFLLHGILLNPHFARYPPARTYCISFWKWAIQNLEGLAAGEDVEIDERVYAHLISLMPDSSESVSGVVPPDESYITYLWRTQQPINSAVYPGLENVTLFESRTLIESGTTGLKTWGASFVLAEYLIAHSEIVRKKRVLELGCGSGFLGIVMASLQLQDELSGPSAGVDLQTAMWLTDINGAVLKRCQDNVKLPCNASSHHPYVRCQTLDWLDSRDPGGASPLNSLLCEIGADVVVGADIVYDPTIIPDLITTLRLALATRKESSDAAPYALVALTVRNEHTLQEFVSKAAQLLQIYEIQMGTEVGARPSIAAKNGYQEVKIYKITT